MTDKINGRTPEEIKKALWCCGNDEVSAHCGNCPYNLGTGNYGCIAEHNADALALIQQLENHIGELTEKVRQFERERDSAVEDARRSNNCKICKHNKKWGGDCEGWSLCGYNMPNWEWRGVQEVE